MVKTYDRVKLHAALDHVLDAKKYAKDSKTDASRYSARPAALKYTTVAQMQAAKEDPDSAYDLYAEGKISEALYEAVCKRGVLKYAKDSKTDASRYSARPAALKYTTVAQMQAAKEDPDSAYDLYAEGKISEALYEAVCKRGVLKYR